MTDEAEQAAREWADEWLDSVYDHAEADLDWIDMKRALKAGQAHGERCERERLKQKALAYKSGVGSVETYVQGHWDGQKALFEHLFGEEQA